MSEIPLVAVVEDDDSVSRMVASLIRSAGFVVEIFRSAEDFVRSNHVPHAACLVMNVQQQGMSGLQLQSHLASSSRHIPIIFITASPGKESQALARELGAVNLLHNPVGDKALLKQIYLILKPEGIN